MNKCTLNYKSILRAPNAVFFGWCPVSGVRSMVSGQWCPVNLLLFKGKQSTCSFHNHNQKYTMGDKKIDEWAQICARTGCDPGFVAVTLCTTYNHRLSLQIDLELAKLLILQGDLCDCELDIRDDNQLFNVLLAHRKIERRPEDSDEDYNTKVAFSFDVVKEQLPDKERALVETSKVFEMYPPLGCPQLLISGYQD